jgi:SAM-dependent methyltransferase
MAGVGMSGAVATSKSLRADQHPEFLRTRRSDVHAVDRGSPFAYVALQLQSLVADLVAGAALRDGAKVLDYGCAGSPYRGLLPPNVEYAGADLEGNDVADVRLRPDGSVPLPNDWADVVLSTQVLEHVADPAGYLAECARILKPGASLVLTTHGMMYLHRDPEDYWRWTCDGLARVVTQAGLVVEDQRGLLGLVPSALQFLQDGSVRRIPVPLRKPYVAAFQGLIAWSDRRSSDQSRRENGLVLGVRATCPA